MTRATREAWVDYSVIATRLTIGMALAALTGVGIFVVLAGVVDVLALIFGHGGCPR